MVKSHQRAVEMAGRRHREARRARRGDGVAERGGEGEGTVMDGNADRNELERVKAGTVGAGGEAARQQASAREMENGGGESKGMTGRKTVTRWDQQTRPAGSPV